MAVAAGQEILLSLALGERSNKVNMNCVESTRWSWELSWRWMELFWSLHEMTSMTVVDNVLHCIMEPPPDVVPCNESLC